MSAIPGLDRPAPVSSELTKPFWDACNERRLVLQNCTACQTVALSAHAEMQQVRLERHLVWKEVQGKGHIDVFFVIRDSRIRGFRSAQPINFAVITLGRGPGHQFPVQSPGQARRARSSPAHLSR